ncbi:PREDICTED: condensin complex subunit 3-like [Priapulus caudatus]|uniref:Condensin complex subunit 3-like n=1 Tax=Priapulus caudatus TaxID=37621 RepID=A0ABM1DSK6_PRICU|nr:PREDICTED: condensin complex subunit 3-like [Priapulus caudatus]XP_014662927.1 PREDICTED: condensin complex subunit 3-like [Priapulus caudatus]
MDPGATVKEVFSKCQHSTQNKAQLQKELLACHDKMGDDNFYKDFIHHLKYLMIVYEQEPAVERSIDFVTEFIASFHPSKKDISEDKSEESSGDEMHPFILKFFNFLLKSHGARDRAVRMRSCQIINKLLNNLGDAQIDDELFEGIYRAMLERVKDKYPVVRVQAVTALIRLQDPSDTGCPIIAAYIFLLERDPNAQVRRTVLSAIATSKKTAPVIIGRTQDVSTVVRKHAYKVLAEKVHIRGLPIAKRVKLLKRGLCDRSSAVKEACSQGLLQSWLRMCNDSVVDLLRCLDVENSCEATELIMKNLLGDVPAKELAEKFLPLLNESLVIEEANLNSEVATYWQCVCSHLKSLGVTGEEQMERLLPDLTQFCNYMRQYVLAERAERSVEDTLQQSYISQQLLTILSLYDCSDEAGRKVLCALVDELLVSPATDATLVKGLMSQLCVLRGDDAARVQYVVELIADVRQPIASAPACRMSENEQRERDLKVAKLRVMLMERRDELEDSIKEQDFVRAAQLKEDISELEQQKEDLLDQPSIDSQETQMEKDDEATLMKALTMAKELLQKVTISTLTPAMHSLLQTLILPAVQSEDPALRQLAVECLGLCCLISKELARTHLLLFIQILQLDQEALQVAALHAVFDLILTYGLESFCATGKTDGDKRDSVEGAQRVDLGFDDTSERAVSPDAASESQLGSDGVPVDTATSIICILSELLNSENLEIRTLTAEGMAKLMLTGRVTSPKLLSHLLLLWYNPVTEDDTLLRQCLGAFLPVFAFASRANQECVAEAFLPTLQTLFDAPLSSPLAEVNDTNVAKLMVDLTCSYYLSEAAKRGVDAAADSIHDTLAVKICNQILSDPESFGTLTLCKALGYLDLNSNASSVANDLKVLAEDMLNVVSGRQCLRLLEKFSSVVSKSSQTNAEDEGDDKSDGQLTTGADCHNEEEADDRLQGMNTDAAVTIVPESPDSERATNDNNNHEDDVDDDDEGSGDDAAAADDDNDYDDDDDDDDDSDSSIHDR